MASADVWRAFPNTVWPTSAGGTPERSSACFAATAPSSMAERSFRVPPNVPKPVRTPERNTTSVLEPWVFIWGEAPRETRGISGGSREGGRARGPEAVEMDVVQPGVPDGSRGSAVPLKRPGQARLRADAEPRVHSRPRRRRHIQVTYAGTPVATMPSPINACTGRAHTVFSTIATAAVMNSAGVTG